MILVTKTSQQTRHVILCVCASIYLFGHVHAIRPYPPSHSVPLALVLMKGGSIILCTKTLCVCVCVLHINRSGLNHTQ